MVEQARETPSISRQYRGSRSITNALLAIVAVVVLVLLAYIGAVVLGWQLIFGILIPYLAILLFVIGFLYRVLLWAGAPVPFHIVTVCGQQKSLPWIKSNKIESPTSTLGVVV